MSRYKDITISTMNDEDTVGEVEEEIED